MRKVIAAAQTNYEKRESYIMSEWGSTETYPYSGIKVHVAADLESPEFPNMLMAISDRVQSYDTNGMKTQRYTFSGQHLRNNKGITIYPNTGSENTDLHDPAGNFENALMIAKEIDSLLDVERFKRRAPNPYKTDLAVGKSNLVGIRYAAFRVSETDQGINFGNQVWVDNRNNSFLDNIPDPELLAKMLETGKAVGLELNPNNCQIRVYEIDQASSLAELADRLRGRIGVISDRGKEYSGDVMAEMVEGFASGELQEESVTSTLGLRNKVRQLTTSK